MFNTQRRSFTKKWLLHGYKWRLVLGSWVTNLEIRDSTEIGSFMVESSILQPMTCKEIEHPFCEPLKP